MTEIVTKRVREEPSDDDGQRLLVDRLWPRGVTKEQAALDGHPKDVAPSNELRKWFHGGGSFEEFADKYRAELDDSQAAADFVQEIKQLPKVTLLYGAKDTQQNHAEVLKQWLEEHL
ncbi:DUF488 family protein [Kocuria soli]|uniref:DUF488 family protein n=1 Tax=Kocuria soli TaxID=2485125 RepID=A0A3N3ZZM0_9MICC|nr:DUF488 family protein [Kocuria soli]ROZ64598.1 DUF488 family protein [Kocuria soli]